MLFNSIVGKVIQVPHIFGLKYAGSEVKNLPAMQETRIQSLGWEDSMEREMAIHSSILAWKIQWTEEPGGPQSLGLQESDTS